MFCLGADVPGNTTLTFEPQVVLKDGPLVLTCDVSDVGQPAVSEYRWTRNGDAVAEVRGAVWSVDRATLHHQANYTCAPVNEAGEGDTAYLDLAVYGALFLHFLCLFACPSTVEDEHCNGTLVVGTRLTFRTPLVALVTPSHVLASH